MEVSFYPWGNLWYSLDRRLGEPRECSLPALKSCNNKERGNLWPLRSSNLIKLVFLNESISLYRPQAKSRKYKVSAASETTSSINTQSPQRSNQSRNWMYASQEKCQLHTGAIFNSEQILNYVYFCFEQNRVCTTLYINTTSFGLICTHAQR
jgi:hypothetical protein